MPGRASSRFNEGRFTTIDRAKDPQAWLADVLARIADHPASKINELLPWNWRHRPRSPRQPDRGAIDGVYPADLIPSAKNDEDAV